MLRADGAVLVSMAATLAKVMGLGLVSEQGRETFSDRDTVAVVDAK